MTPSPKDQAGKRSCRWLLLLALLCLAGTACSTTAPTGTILFEDARGAVSLQTISSPLVQASHPIKLEPALLSQLLAGLEIHEAGTGPHRRVESGFAGQPSTYPLFSKDQIQFLAPLLAEGLRTATPNQSIEYRVVTTHEGSNRFQSATTETTAGSLYADGRQLYVILSQYRYDPIRTNENIADLSNRSHALDYSGLTNRTLLFTPEAALEPIAESADNGKVDRQVCCRRLSATGPSAPGLGNQEESWPSIGRWRCDGWRIARRNSGGRSRCSLQRGLGSGGGNPQAGSGIHEKNNSAARTPDKIAQSRKPRRYYSNERDRQGSEG